MEFFLRSRIAMEVMNMPFSDLREFISALEAAGEAKTVNEEVD